MNSINKKILLCSLGLCGMNSIAGISSLGFVAPGVDSETAVLNPEQGEIVFTDDSATTDLKVYNGTTWQSLIDVNGQSASNDAINIGLATSVSSNALTISLKTAAGTDPSVSDVVKIGFRNATASNGQFVQRSITSALSLTISSGSTLGHSSATADVIYVYAIDSGSGVVLGAVSSPQFMESDLVTSTAEGGAGAADSASVLYSSSAQTSKPVRLIGRLRITETTAGTWASNATTVELLPVFQPLAYGTSVFGRRASAVKTGVATVNCDGSSATVSNPDAMISGNPTNFATSECTVTLVTGYFSAQPICLLSQISTGGTNNGLIWQNPTSATSVTIGCRQKDGTDCSVLNASLMCVGSP